MDAPAAGSGRLLWPLSIALERTGGVLLLKASGRLGTLSSGTLIEMMVEAIQTGDRRIVLDLSQVDYISSAGLLALEALVGRMHQAEARLVVCGLNEPVRIALDLAGLLATLESLRDVSEALAHFAAGAESAQ